MASGSAGASGPSDSSSTLQLANNDDDIDDSEAETENAKDVEKPVHTPAAADVPPFMRSEDAARRNALLSLALISASPRSRVPASIHLR